MMTNELEPFRFTGEEVFPAPRGDSLVSTRLADFTDQEILFMANTFQQDGDHDPAQTLLEYLNERRKTHR